MTVLKHLGQIDTVIDTLVDRPIPKKAEKARIMLRLAAAQSLFLQTPAYAVISSTTHCADQLIELQKYKGFIHAISRRISERGAEKLAKIPLTANLPDWLYHIWEQTYTSQTVQALCAAHLQHPPLDLTVKNPEEIESLAEKLDAEILPTGSLRRQSAQGVETLSGYQEGLWWVQDFSASLPVKILNPQAGETVLDACAAPGGKSLQIAATGAHLTALELSEPRLKILKENFRRMKLEVNCIQADALTWMPEKTLNHKFKKTVSQSLSSPELFDAVLLDAPCSATGTLRRAPDIAWRKTPENIQALQKTQIQLLKQAQKWLKPSGRLVFCVCSLQPQEGVFFRDHLTSLCPDFIIDPILPEEFPFSPENQLPKGAFEKGTLQLFPHFQKEKGGMDGFFILRLKKRI